MTIYSPHQKRTQIDSQLASMHRNVVWICAPSSPTLLVANSLNDFLDFATVVLPPEVCSTRQHSKANMPIQVLAEERVRSVCVCVRLTRSERDKRSCPQPPASQSK